jgi:hypothetical protein
MPVPDIILNSGEVLVTSAASWAGILPIDSTITFGYVEMVSDLSDIVTVGTIVFYNQKDARKFMYGSTFYFIIREEKITGTEVTPP